MDVDLPVQRLRPPFVPCVWHNDVERRQVRTLRFRENKKGPQVRRSSEKVVNARRKISLLALIAIGVAVLTPGCFQRNYRQETSEGNGTPRPSPISKAPISAGRFKVVKIVDGDTIDVINANDELIRVRLAGIDAPEQGQPFSKVAKKALAEMVLKQEVTLEGDKTDRWKRRVAKVITDRDVCLEIVRKGLAWHYKKYKDEQSPADRETYERAEQQARENRVGIWQEPGPVPPWELREMRRKDS